MSKDGTFSIDSMFQQALGDSYERNEALTELDELNEELNGNVTLSVGKIVKEKKRSFDGSSRLFDDEEEEEYDDGDSDFFEEAVGYKTSPDIEYQDPDLDESQQQFADKVLYEESPTEGFDLSSSTSFHFLPTKQIDGFILIEGTYSNIFVEFLENAISLPAGDVYLAIRLNGEEVAVKGINPEPRTLHLLEKLLAGYKLSIFDGKSYLPFDKYYYLDKIKFAVRR